MSWTIAGRTYNEISEVRKRIRELDALHPGQRFPDERRDEWNELNEVWEDEELSIRRDAVERAFDRGLTEDGTDPGPRRGAEHLSTVRQQALRANESAVFLSEASREHMETQIRLDDDPSDGLARATVALADRAYFRAFSRVFNDPVAGGHEWTPQEREAVRRVKDAERTMSLGGTGGMLTPYELDPAIILAGVGATSPLREISRVVTTSQNTKKFVTSLGVTTHWDPEEQESTDDSPVLVQPSIDCKKGAADVVVSYELFEDSDIAKQIGGVLADAKNVWESLSFTLTQTNRPTGLITALVAAGGGTIIATGTNVLAQGDLYANQAALPARWQANASWMMALPILNGYRQLPQATGLNYSIVNDDTTPPKILGRPAYVNSSMDSTLTGAAADYLVVNGDFNQFAVVDRIGSTIELLPGYGAARRPSGQKHVYLHWRVGSGLLVADAFRLSNFST